MLPNIITTAQSVAAYHDNSPDHLIREIPEDLFPVNKKGINLAWGKKAYIYTHLFNSTQFASTSYATDDEVDQWVTFAKEMWKNITKDGLAVAKDKIVDVAKKDFGFKMPLCQHKNQLGLVM
eukprot:8991900-Ditylum_brightwellii.AAC.1